jgi:hypothetical protein
MRRGSPLWLNRQAIRRRCGLESILTARSPGSVLTSGSKGVLTMTTNQPQPTKGRPGTTDLRTRLIPATAIRIVAAVGIAIATLGLVTTAFSPPATAQTATGPQPCVNGIVPLNPYVVNCNLPLRGNHVIGAAPDAGAIIGCRHNLACLALYVNYPGQLLVPGYRP